MTNSESTQLREQMARIRTDLTQEVGDVVDQAKELADWRNFVGRHPWLCTGAAVAIGYLIVPQRRQAIATDADSLAEGATPAKLDNSSQPKPAQQASLLGPLVGIAANAILRNVLTIAGNQLRNVLVSNPGPRASEETQSKTPT